MPILSLSIVEIIVLMLGAIVLGITIHFFIISRRNLQQTITDGKKNNNQLNEWKLKYFDEVEIRGKELSVLQQRVEEAEENSKIFSIEAEEMRKQNKRLTAELEETKKTIPAVALQAGSKFDYYEQLKETQSSLQAQNEKLNRLLSNIDLIKEAEEKQKTFLRDKKELICQVEELQTMLSQKEAEIAQIKRSAHLSKEMTSMLDNAYAEFGVLQEKIQKLESQINTSKNINLEYEDLKEAHYKLQHDYDEQKQKLEALSTENKELQVELKNVDEQFRDASFQRQQLQKRVAYLEELNNDMQAVADANKRLENQIRRIGELESMLNMVAEERDQLIRRHSG